MAEQIGQFPSKASAKRFAQLTLRNEQYREGKPLVEFDKQRMADILLRHYRAVEKIGVGISDIYVQSNGNGQWQFVIRRHDGSEVAFSYKVALDGHPEQRAIEKIKEAIWWDIRPQLSKFAEAEFERMEALGRTIYCPIIADRHILVTRENHEVDHIPPATLAQLRTDWLATEGLDLMDVEVAPSDELIAKPTMGNRGQRVSWQTYHAEYARLRLVSPDGNCAVAMEWRANQ